MQPRTPLLFILFGSVAGPGATSPIRAQDAVNVRAPVFDIEYRVNADAQPLESVRLWYTADGGLSWVEFGLDEDRVSPIRFRSPAEGLFGFFFVLTNASGPSSAPPTKNTPPQRWALVDFTPPVVQFHGAKLTTSFGEPVVQIRWTAVDAQLLPRPIELLYAQPPDEKWIRMTAEPVANTGRFDWRVPTEISGSVAIRIAVTDRGGHRTESETLTVDLAELNSPSAPAGSAAAVGATGIADDAALAGSPKARERAASLLAEAVALRDRGEFAQGVSRLREAVKLDPRMTPAFAEMAGMLYRLGDLDRAVSAYEIALKQQPNSREALRGLATVYQQKRDYAASAEKLRTILRYNPADAEVWLQLGDVAVYQGDEVRARECYTRATQIDPKAAQVIADARQRLALMAEVSRDPVAKKR